MNQEAEIRKIIIDKINDMKENELNNRKIIDHCIEELRASTNLINIEYYYVDSFMQVSEDIYLYVFSWVDNQYNIGMTEITISR